MYTSENYRGEYSREFSKEFILKISSASSIESIFFILGIVQFSKIFGGGYPFWCPYAPFLMV